MKHLAISFFNGLDFLKELTFINAKLKREKYEIKTHLQYKKITKWNFKYPYF